jgi:Kdo2-lipid IVA lauroyltransferase/acyltransferase
LVRLPKRLRRASRSLLLRGLIRVGALLPLRAGLAVGTFAGNVGWYLAPPLRRRMLANLAIAFPLLTPAERARIGRHSLVHLAWLATEMVTAHSYAKRLEDYVSFVPGAEERLRGLMAQGRGLIMVSGHIGHWELLARRVVRAGVPSATIARAGSDPKLDAVLGQFRREGAFDVLLRDAPSTGRAIIRCLRQGKLLGLLIDQDTRVQGVFVPFFGHPAWTPRAAGDLALRFKAPVAAIWSRRRGPRPGDGHELSVVEVPYDAEAPDREAESVRITAACTALLEQAIREHPAEWVWMHERWHRRPESPQA